MAIDSNSTFSNDNHFEAEVRRIGKEIWPTGRIERSPIVDNHERDAIIYTNDMIFVIEATTSRKKEKIETDAKKQFN